MREVHRRDLPDTPSARDRDGARPHGPSLARRRAREFLLRVRDFRRSLHRVPIPLVLLGLAGVFAWLIPWLQHDHHARERLLQMAATEAAAKAMERNASQVARAATDAVSSAAAGLEDDILPFQSLDQHACKESELTRTLARISSVEGRLSAMRSNDAAQEASAGLLELMRARDTAPDAAKLMEMELKVLKLEVKSCHFFYGPSGAPDANVDARTIDDLLSSGATPDAGPSASLPSDSLPSAPASATAARSATTASASPLSSLSPVHGQPAKSSASPSS